MINFGPLDGKGPIRNLLESTIDKSLPTSQVTNVYARMYARVYGCYAWMCVRVCMCVYV